MSRFTSALILVFLCASCSHLFYYPSDKVFYRPEKMGVEYQDIYLTTEDGLRLHGMHLHAKGKSRGVVLHFHGNAQNMTSHFINVAWLTKKNYDVIVFDYRGYGQSEGEPDQRGTFKDAITFLNYTHELYKKRKLDKFIVFGQSLGGVISLSALPDFEHIKDVDLISVDSTFSSYKWIAFDKLTLNWFTIPLSPLAFVLVSDAKESLSRINKLKNPLLVIHGKGDPVVPFKFGKEIYDEYESKKWLWETASKGHTDVFWRQEVNYREKYIKLLETL